MASSPQGSASNQAIDSFVLDVEQKSVDDAYLNNSTISTFAWQGINVTIKDRESSQPKAILENVEGYVNTGNISKIQYVYILLLINS